MTDVVAEVSKQPSVLGMLLVGAIWFAKEVISGLKKKSEKHEGDITEINKNLVVTNQELYKLTVSIGNLNKQLEEKFYQVQRNKESLDHAHNKIRDIGIKVESLGDKKNGI